MQSRAFLLQTGCLGVLLCKHPKGKYKKKAMHKVIRTIEITNILYFITQFLLIYFGNKYPYWGIPSYILIPFLIGCLLAIPFFLASIVFTILENKYNIRAYGIPLIVLNAIMGIINFFCFLGLMPV